MSSLVSAIFEIKQLDLQAYSDSPIHRLDARAKVLATVVFCIMVISVDKYNLSALLPYFIFPSVMIARSNLSPMFFFRKYILLCPFILIIAAFNPVFDRTVVLQIGAISITGGWISFFSIFVRSTLTITTALILVGVTGFTDICRALEKLGVPQIFTIQLMFLYRYIFILMDEGVRISRSRDLRSFNNRGKDIKSYSSIIGYLFLQTWNRAERIHMAMLARGFTGNFPSPKTGHMATRDYLWLLGWVSLFLLFRLINLPQALGNIITGNF